VPVIVHEPQIIFFGERV